jgi:hypothetical protein
MTDVLVLKDGSRGRVVRPLAHGYVVSFVGSDCTRVETIGDDQIQDIIFDHAGWVTDLEESAAMIYVAKAQSPREMTPEWWERVVAKFPSSARHSLHLAERLRDDPEDDLVG